jgi:ribonucleoside-diphosphate reductase alpha chain
MSSEQLSHAADDVVAAQDSAEAAAEGLVIDPQFCPPGAGPFEQVTWETRCARICGSDEAVVFEQDDVEAPSSWSPLATNVVASKYFYGEDGSGSRERSVRQLLYRVCRTIADWGKRDGLFATAEDGERFYRELLWLCLNQHGAFNSPVWFNVGLFHQYGIPGSEGNYHWDAAADEPVRTRRSYEHPQVSACFIQSVDDTMEDIMRLATAEAMLFKYGSGTGTDLSTLRSSREKLAGGGVPSGPLSFMRVYDQIAAVVKSGGKTRRAAKMQSLRCDHPDIREFITCKMEEEKKAWALIEQGYDGSFTGDAYASVMFQNANLSVRVTDEFMQAAMDDATWQTFSVTTGDPMGTHKAQELLRLMAEGAHVCGDPGVQYHSTINRWHTCKASGEIRASNPCSEYMFLDDSACNLASLNLTKFRRPDGGVDTARLAAAARIFVIAQDILVDHASYPTARIARHSHEFRSLGLGYANLGGLLMSLGLAYDGDGGRAVASAVTAVLTGAAYAASAELASRRGAFARFPENRESMMEVIAAHRAALAGVGGACPAALRQAAQAAWDRALADGERFGYRNAQVTVLAPTGTIGFMMDCDTTGVEPDIALVKYKNLAGGGMLKIVNSTVPLALERLGYSAQQVGEIMEYIDKHDTIEGAPHLDEEHLRVFDCAFRPANGRRCIHHMGHLRMMAAVQPFLSGAISKTVNVPNEATAEEIRDLFVAGWRLGLKAVAVYRDGSKRTQPLNVADQQKAKASGLISPEELELARRSPHRNHLPATRPSITHKFDVAGHEGYLTVGLYEDGQPGELFITMAKEGSTVGGMMDAFATAISLCVQYGVPLEALVRKFTHQRFEPNGMTSNREIPFAKSIVDYIFRWMGLTFLEGYRKENLPGGREWRSPIPRNPAVPEAVKEDQPSEPGGAAAGRDMDASRSAGALFAARHTGGAGDRGGGNGEGNGGGNGDSVPPGVRAEGRPPAAARRLRTTQRAEALVTVQRQQDAPPCSNCGQIMIRNGSCYKCPNCGSTSGCS